MLALAGLVLSIALLYYAKQRRAEIDALRAENFRYRAFLESAVLGEEYGKWVRGQPLSPWLWRRRAEPLPDRKAS